MTVEKLTDLISAELICGKSNKVTGCYICDLLSWVMGNAKENDAWLTIMSNVNVAAVASLCGVSCVVICEGVKPDPDLIQKAKQHDVTILTTPKTAYEVAKLISKFI